MRLITRGKERPKQRQAKQRRHDPEQVHPPQQQQRRALHLDACSSHTFNIRCILSSSSPCVERLLSVFPCLYARLLTIQGSLLPWSLDAAAILNPKAPTSQQVIPATPPIAIIHQTVHYQQHCDAPHLSLRVEDIVWPFAYQRLPLRSKSWDKHLEGPPIITITTDSRVHRRVYLISRSFCTLTRRLRPHYLYRATSGICHPASTLPATPRSLTTPIKWRTTHDHDPAQPATRRDTKQYSNPQRLRMTMALRRQRLFHRLSRRHRPLPHTSATSQSTATQNQ